MGAVYRALDTKLNREVAIKILPAAFAADPERMARFAREAQVLASLNHPNIAAIYGIEEGAMIMELVDGANLAGPVPLGTALDYARQIAAGLSAAHEKGIVHRDLKPANIKVTTDDTVKLLDFGLATGREARASAAAADPDVSPTESLTMTAVGTILGTAAYMAPEQARGKTVDKRADIWAFGAVLYEVLTGSRLFRGDDVTEVLASVIKETPDLGRTPPEVRRLLAACLERNPESRLHDIADWRLLLDAPSPAAAKPRPPPGHYIASGEWNLLGGYAESPHPDAAEKRVRMVAGACFGAIHNALSSWLVRRWALPRNGRRPNRAQALAGGAESPNK
jgi:serine/threonine-protein kinase